MDKIFKQLSQALILITTFLGLTACVSINRIPIQAEQRKMIHHTNEILTSRQENIEVEQQNNIGQGVIGSIIVAQINAHNEKLIAPVQQSLDKKPYEKMVNKYLVQELKSVQWLKLDKSSIKNEWLNYGQKKNLINYSPNPGDAIIYVDLTYQFNSWQNAIVIEADVEIYRKNDPKADLIYKNEFKYIDVLKHNKAPEDNIKIWAANDAAKTKQAMKSAAQQLSQAIAKDLQNPNLKPDTQHPTNIWYSDIIPGAALLGGYLEGKVGDHYVIRGTRGNIVITNGPEVKQKNNWRE